jgi:hypothetical protein
VLLGKPMQQPEYPSADFSISSHTRFTSSRLLASHPTASVLFIAISFQFTTDYIRTPQHLPAVPTISGPRRNSRSSLIPQHGAQLLAAFHDAFHKPFRPLSPSSNNSFAFIVVSFLTSARAA